MTSSIVSHVVARALGSRHGIYLDTNAWSELAKSNIPNAPLRDWLQARGQTLIITRFSIGELSKDDRLANRVATLIEGLDVVFADLGTNDLSGRKRKDIPYELLLRLTPGSDAAKEELIKLFQNRELRETMVTLEKDAAQWQRRVEDAIASRKRPWTWNDFGKILRFFVEGTCVATGREFVESAFEDPDCYVGIKLAFGVVIARYFIARKKFAYSDYVDFLHCSDMAYFDTIVTESALCEAISQVQKRLPGHGASKVLTLQWLSKPT